MQETRTNKIARLLQKELSTIFQRETMRWHGIVISVTRVHISADLSICTAYLSIFPNKDAKQIMANIQEESKSLRYKLGLRIRHQLRIIPQLRFFLDDTLDYLEHIDDLLKGSKEGLPLV